MRNRYAEAAFAAGVEVARLRRENAQLLDELGDLRMLYEICCNDRDRAIEVLNGFTGPDRPRTTAPTGYRATTPPDQVAAGTR